MIHGYLHIHDDGGVVFRNKGNELRAEASVLRLLNSELLSLNEASAKAFADFYKKLVNGAPTDTEVEATVLKALESMIKVRGSEAVLGRSRNKLAEVQDKLSESKTRLRNSRSRLQTALETFPPEYRALVLERADRLQRRAQIAERIAHTGIDDPRLEIETANLKSLDERLKTLVDRDLVTPSDAERDRVMSILARLCAASAGS